MGPQVRFFKNLFKTNISFIGQARDVGYGGRTKAKWVDYQGKSKQKKTVLKKEASFTADILARIKSGSYTETDQLHLLNQCLSFDLKYSYSEEQLKAALNNNFTGFDESSKKCLQKVSALLKKLPNGYDDLYTHFVPTIRKERAYAAISAIFVRILVGPSAPKVKFLNQPSNANDHLKLLSSRIDAKDLVDTAADDRTSQLLANNAHKIAAAAVVRDLLGCETFENKPDNYLFVTGNKGVTVVPIDTDYCFSNTHPRLVGLPLGSEGAKLLLPLESDKLADIQNKQNWDSLFHNSNNNAVRKSMYDVFELAANVFTKEFVEKVVNYICTQSGGLLALEKADQDHVVNFLVKSGTISQSKLDKNTPKDPAILAPWLEDMMTSFEIAECNNNNNIATAL